MAGWVEKTLLVVSLMWFNVMLKSSAKLGVLTLEMAERGFTITAVDIVQNALDEIQYKAHQGLGEQVSITTVCDTMNQHSWPFANDNQYDVVATLRCNRYIQDFGGFLRE